MSPSVEKADACSQVALVMNGIAFSFHIILITSSSSLMFEDCFNFIDFFAF
jgi:hypothetical protein